MVGKARSSVPQYTSHLIVGVHMLNVKLLQELLAKEQFHTDNKTQELRKILPIIEQFVDAGIPLKKFVDILNISGMEISLFTFKTILARLRKEIKEQNPVKGAAQSFNQQPMQMPLMPNQTQNIPYAQGTPGAWYNERGECMGYSMSRTQAESIQTPPTGSAMTQGELSNSVGSLYEQYASLFYPNMGPQMNSPVRHPGWR